MSILSYLIIVFKEKKNLILLFTKRPVFALIYQQKNHTLSIL